MLSQAVYLYFFTCSNKRYSCFSIFYDFSQTKENMSLHDFNIFTQRSIFVHTPHQQIASASLPLILIYVMFSVQRPIPDNRRCTADVILYVFRSCIQQQTADKPIHTYRNIALCNSQRSNGINKASRLRW